MLHVIDTFTNNLSRRTCVKNIFTKILMCPYFPNKISEFILRYKEYFEQRHADFHSDTLAANKEELLMKIDKLELVQALAAHLKLVLLLKHNSLQ